MCVCTWQRNWVDCRRIHDVARLTFGKREKEEEEYIFRHKQAIRYQYKHNTSCACGGTICPRPSPPPVGALAPRAPPSRRNVAVLSHAEYAPLPIFIHADHVIRRRRFSPRESVQTF